MHRLGARGRRSAESHARQAKGRLYLLQVNHDETRRNCVQVLHLQHASSHHALPLRLLLAEGGAGAPHLEDVEAAARQQQNFSLCKNVFISFVSIAKAARVGGGGGVLPPGMLLRALMSTPLTTRMRKMVRSPCNTAGVT
jgi:hypothetical protein